MTRKGVQSVLHGSGVSLWIFVALTVVLDNVGADRKSDKGIESATPSMPVHAPMYEGRTTGANSVGNAAAAEEHPEPEPPAQVEGRHERGRRPAARAHSRERLTV